MNLEGPYEEDKIETIMNPADALWQQPPHMLEPDLYNRQPFQNLSNWHFAP